MIFKWHIPFILKRRCYLSNICKLNKSKTINIPILNICSFFLIEVIIKNFRRNLNGIIIFVVYLSKYDKALISFLIAEADYN